MLSDDLLLATTGPGIPNVQRAKGCSNESSRQVALITKNYKDPGCSADFCARGHNSGCIIGRLKLKLVPARRCADALVWGGSSLREQDYIHSGLIYVFRASGRIITQFLVPENSNLDPKALKVAAYILRFWQL